MRVSAKVVARYKDEGKLKGIATVCLNGDFLITGIRIVDCAKGVTVFMPSRKTDSGAYKDICFPITTQLHQQIKEAVLEAYAKQSDDMPTVDPAEEAPQDE